MWRVTLANPFPWRGFGAKLDLIADMEKTGCFRPTEGSRFMLFMTSRAGRSSHLASQVRLLPPGPGWVWEKAGVALGRDVARGPWAGPAEGVCGPRSPLGRPPFHGQPSLCVRAALLAPGSPSSLGRAPQFFQLRQMSQVSKPLHHSHL